MIILCRWKIEQNNYPAKSFNFFHTSLSSPASSVFSVTASFWLSLLFAVKLKHHVKVSKPIRLYKNIFINLAGKWYVQWHAFLIPQQFKHNLDWQRKISLQLLNRNNEMKTHVDTCSKIRYFNNLNLMKSH